MIKEFEINDILSGVNIFCKRKKKNTKTIKKENAANIEDILALNNQTKSSKAEVLVLD